MFRQLFYTTLSRLRAEHSYNVCMVNHIAALQMHSGDDLNANLVQAESLIAQAADHGARVAVLPESFALLGDDEAAQLSVAETLGGGAIQDFLSTVAARHGIWLVGGSIPIRANASKAYSTSLLFDDNGNCVTQYRKIHLFDVFVEETGERYGESSVFEAGAQVVVADTPCGRIGMTICYDLRFPELFRRLIDRGAEYIVLPAAFTASTGMAHWHTLLRSRAIENAVFVVAANQGNRHRGRRDCFGHSVIIDPWGEILCELDDDVGVAVAPLDAELQARIRRDFPCLQHRRLDVQAGAEQDSKQLASA